MKIKFNFKEKVENILIYFQKRNWIITILIFLIVFCSAIFVWWDCILDPQPSQAILESILKTEQEYKSKMETIKKNHQGLVDQNQRFNNPEKNLRDRDYFEPWEPVEKILLENNSSEKGFNPEMVN